MDEARLLELPGSVALEDMAAAWVVIGEQQESWVLVQDVRRVQMVVVVK